MPDRAFRPGDSPGSNQSGGASGGSGRGPVPAAHPDRWYTWALRRRVLGALVCAILAFALGRAAVGTAWGQGMDTLFMESAIHWSDRFGGVSELVTSFVSLPMIVLVGVLIAFFALIRRRRTLAGRALVVVLGANATTQLVKWLVDRPDLHVTTAIPNSLPSGHTTVAISFALALVMVAPNWSRGPVAWLGWAWTSLMGVSVMVSAWHRLADVLVAVLIAGAWALALTPIERRERHVPQARRVMAVLVLVLLVLASLLSFAALRGVDLVAVATPGASGFGYSEFLAEHAWRARLLASAGTAWVVGACGAVLHEVDALCVNRS